MRIPAIGSSNMQASGSLQPSPPQEAPVDAPAAAAGGKPQLPLDQLADELKSTVLQAQDVAAADADGASNEMLTQLFRTLVDLLAEPPLQPGTKLDV